MIVKWECPECNEMGELDINLESKSGKMVTCGTCKTHSILNWVVSVETKAGIAHLKSAKKEVSQ